MMKIKLGEKEVTVYVKEVYMDDNKELKEEIMTLEEWETMVSKKGISTLYALEEELTRIIGKPVKLSYDYPEMRKPVLNLCGCVSRLSKNLIIVED